MSRNKERSVISSRSENEMEKIIPEDYNDFINQLDIYNISVESSRMKKYDCDEMPEHFRVTINMTANYENDEDQAIVFIHQTYTLTLKDEGTKKNVAKLTVTFCVEYSSDIPMSDEHMDVFVDTNLPLNTWPYFREYSHNSLARMGFMDVIAPVVRGLSHKKS